MTRNSKRALRIVLCACLALCLAGAGCGDTFDTDKCKDLTNLCDVEGMMRCLPTLDGNEVCAKNADGCLVWTAGVPCGVGQACSEADGQCRCNNTCNVVDSTECNGNVIQTCTANSAGCLGWVAGIDCATTGQICDESSGAAVCAATCTDACASSERRCQGNILQGCAREVNGCLGWVDLTDCAAEDASCVFVAGQPTCLENCQDECATADYPQCSADFTARLTCVAQMDGCTDIITTPCDAGDVCDPTLDPPACALDCTGECTEGDATCGADGLSLDICTAQADACNAVVNVPCNAGEICDTAAVPAVCVACTPDCAGKECGPDGCLGECGPGCTLPQVCNDATGQCEGCLPDCTGKVCGDDGCGGSCGECGADQTCRADGTACDCTTGADAIVDGSFEAGAGGGTWTEYSSAYGTPVCIAGVCGDTNYAVEGEWWVWMGGGDADDAYVEQSVTIPASPYATLWFYLYMGGCSAGDIFEVTFDGTQVLQLPADDPLYGEGWVPVAVDVSTYADGLPHLVRLHGSVSAGGSIFLDVVQLITCAGGGCTSECNELLFPACNANGNLDTCVMQADGCTDLISTPCNAGETCQGAPGSAVCAAGCVNDCDPAGYPICAAVGEAVETCVLQGDGCYDVISTPCDAGETCELPGGVPTCMVGCADECTAALFPACSADNLAVETCVVQGDGCTDLISTPCGVNELCVDAGGNPVCQPTCMDQCNTVGDTRCNEDIVQECQIQASGCRDWSDLQDCTQTGATCQVSGGTASCVASVVGDTCADAIALDVSTGSAVATVDNTLYSDSFADYSCNSGQTGADVWYSFTLTADAGVILETSAPGTLDDTVMAVFDACGGTEVACDDDSGTGYYSRIETALTAGTYYVVMDPYTTSDLGDWTLTVTVQAAICTPGATQCNVANNVETCNATGTAWVETVCATPCALFGGVAQCPNPGDTCEQAIALDVSTGPDITVVDNTAFTDDYVDYAGCSSTRTNEDGWVSFTLTEEAQVVIETSAAGGVVDDTIIALLDGCGGTQIACDDEGGAGSYSMITATLQPGTYYVVSESYFGGTGDWTVTVTPTYKAAITQWTFLGDTLIPSTGTGTATHGAGQTSSFVTGSPDRAWNLNTWPNAAVDQAAYFQFATDLSGAIGAAFEVDYYHSPTGPTDFELYYSLDGTTFQPVPSSDTPTGPATTWAHSSFDISSFADGQANVIIRIHGYGASAASGTLRVDNVTFSGY